MRFGFHVSIQGRIYKAVRRAKEKGCEAMQIFSRNPRSWKRRELAKEEIERFKKELKEAGISPLVVHTPYLINLASPDPRLYERSIAAFKEDLARAESLEARYFVTHVGSHKGRGEDYGLERIISALGEIQKEQPTSLIILLENTAGIGTSLGYNFAQLKHLIERTKRNKSLGICLDTCHAFAAGYDVSTEAGIEKTLKEIDEFLGLEKLKVIHVNDSKGALNSRVDRHEHIGKGQIGKRGFRLLVNHSFLNGLPVILETPVERENDDEINLRTIKALHRQKFI